MGVITKPFRGILLNRAHPLTKGLVRCWEFNEYTGERINDYSGYSKFGSVAGDCIWGAQGLHIGASEDRVTADFVEGINLSSGAIEIRCRPDWDYTDGNNHYFWDTFGGNNRRFLMWKDAASNLTKLYTDTTDRGNFSFAWAHEVEYHVILNYGINEFYVNGILENNFTDGSLGTGADTFYLGDRYTDLNESFDGIIEYARFWNRNLTLDEIKWLYREPYTMFEQPSRAKYFYVGAPPGISIKVYA